MNDEQRSILLPLRIDIQNKFKYLERARDLNAQPNVLVAIRRKIYQAQDKLLEEAVKLKYTCPQTWFSGK